MTKKKKVIIEGPIYDVTHLAPKEKEEGNKAVDWQRIHSKRVPGKWISVWVSEPEAKGKSYHYLMVMRHEEVWKFYLYLSMFDMPLENGIISMNIRQGTVDRKDAAVLQAHWPGKIMVAILEENGLAEFGPTTYEALRPIKAELTEDDYLWEKRHDAQLRVDKAQGELGEASKELEVLDKSS